MSGRAKRGVWFAASAVLYLAALVGYPVIVCLLYGIGGGNLTFLLVGFAAVLFGVQYVFHEAGHLLFGLFCGMKPYLFRVSYLTVCRGKISFSAPEAAGEVQAYPVRGGHMRRRAIAFSLGGIVSDLLFGGALVAASIFIEHPAAFALGLVGAVSLAEAVIQAIPAEFPVGQTDGQTVFALIKKTPEAEVLLRVWEAQGILARGEFSAVPEELLFSAPVVRDDLPAFHALLLLKTQFLLARGDKEGARAVLSRLAMADGLGSDAERELRRYEGYFAGNFLPDGKEPLQGVRSLECRLAEQTKNSAA